MRDRLQPINQSEPAGDTDDGEGGDGSGRRGPCVLFLATAGVAALVAGAVLYFSRTSAGDEYGFCRHTKHSKPSNTMPPVPNRTVPSSCPKNASRGCHGDQPDDPDCCIGMACCRCSTDATMYNPTPKIFTDFNNFSMDIHVVCADQNVGAFPARPNQATGTKGNIRLVGVALPNGTPPPGGWPVAYMINGAETVHNEAAVFDPDKYCNIENKGCGVNETSPELTQCHGPDGNPNAPPGWHLYSMFSPDGAKPWIDYPWHDLNFVSNYHQRRLVRRLLLNGFAVICPSSWGPGGWYSYDSNPAGQDYNAYNPQNEQGIWPGPDKAFFDVLFDDVAENRFGPLNHTHYHMIGFSSGGFFVSRMIAESSGVLKTQTGRPWPEIASAVMLCSGSFETYNDHGAVVPQEGLPDKYFWQHNGSYRLNVSRRHPPSVIAQPQGDDFVPPTVAENYIQALRAANISAQYVTVPKTEIIAPRLSGLNTTWKHMYFEEMVNPSIELFCKAAGKDTATCLACGDLAPC